MCFPLGEHHPHFKTLCRLHNKKVEILGEKYLPRLFKLTVGDIFSTDYDLSNVEGLVEIKGGNMPYGTLPNNKEGKTYRVIA